MSPAIKKCMKGAAAGLHLAMVPIVISIPLLSSPVIILICTHNPSYEQWLVSMGVGVVCHRGGGGHGC